VQGLGYHAGHGVLVVATQGDAGGEGRLGLRAADSLAELWAMRLRPGHLPSAVAVAGSAVAAAATPDVRGGGPARARGTVFVATYAADGAGGWDEPGPLPPGGHAAGDSAGRAERSFLAAFEVRSPLSPPGVGPVGDGAGVGRAYGMRLLATAGVAAGPVTALRGLPDGRVVVAAAGRLLLMECVPAAGGTGWRMRCALEAETGPAPGAAPSPSLSLVHGGAVRWARGV
jgi:hypothetical protein